MDFNIDIKHDGDIRILQITDMQVIDAHQQRYSGRLTPASALDWVPDNNNRNLYDHIRYLVDKTTPDLILITGDIIYGEFDDKGSSFKEFTDFMDSFAIPWAPIFGNHDNESVLGADWQCEQFEQSKYALFQRGEVFGNGNYTIGISQNGTLQRVIFMMDSNGCDKLKIAPGFREDQLNWLKDETNSIHTTQSSVPVFLCCHIPTMDFVDAYFAKGYMTKEDEGWMKDFTAFDLGISDGNADDDFGKKNEGIKFEIPSMMPLLKACGIDGFFAGHYHKINTSILHEGIRFTFGLKTGYFDYYDEDANGGTLIIMHGKAFDVEHVYYHGV